MFVNIRYLYVNFIFVFTHFRYFLGLLTQNLSHMAYVYLKMNMSLNVFLSFNSLKIHIVSLDLNHPL